MFCTDKIRIIVCTNIQNKMKSLSTDIARFDARIPKSQKLLFEKAALLGGFRNLTDFIIQTLQEKATSIVQEKESILLSERDNDLFFSEILKSTEPNEALKNAFEDYKKTPLNGL